MRFKGDEITSVIPEEIRQYRSKVDLSEVGRVLEVGDGIARVYGLTSAMAGERLEFSNGAAGQVFNLEETSVGVVILGDYLGIREGMEVRRTGELLSVPCGEALIGRGVDRCAGRHAESAGGGGGGARGGVGGGAGGGGVDGRGGRSGRPPPRRQG